ncbi:ribonuclease HI family protein [bacterium]|nr:ribonuclease HI family protein [bacterium]
MSNVRPGVIYTDGACLKNPGPAGAGFVIYDQKGTPLTEGSIPLGQGTNNIAEYSAVIAALEAAHSLSLTHLVIRSDSELLVKQMNGQYRVKDAQLRRLHLQVRELMPRFGKVVFEHIRRMHNERADELAGEAAKVSAKTKAGVS